MYQVRITDSNGTNAIILDKADNITYGKTINSSDEEINFDVPINDSKTALIDYTKLWEFWDTISNKRLNRGPIHTIDASDSTVLKIQGPGRSQFLNDFIQEKVTTFHIPPDSIVNQMRYENVAIEPGTTTHVWDGTNAMYNVFFPEGLVIDRSQYMQFYGLSKSTKDNVLDNDRGEFAIGTNKPFNTYHSTNSVWSGTDVKDSIVIDLGSLFPISKWLLTPAWWGGAERKGNRSYDIIISYSNQDVPLAELTIDSWTELYRTEYAEISTPSQTFASPISARYFRVAITGTHAFYGSRFDNEPAVDRWDLQCDPATNSIMKGKTISDRVTEPQNDCYASVVEFGAYVEIVPINTLTALAHQRIKSDNLAITYDWNVPSNMTVTNGSFRKFESGGQFTIADISWSSAGSARTKFFDNDCSNCYASYKFAAVDQNNSLIYRSSSASGSPTIHLPSRTSVLLMRGATNAVVSNINGWRSKLDSLSYGGYYAYLDGDSLSDTGSAVLKFRGASFKWWATIPSGVTPGVVDIKLRSKNDVTGLWSAWKTLAASFVLPTNISDEVVYEIPYGHYLLNENNSYEISITVLDGYVSIDSFGGLWNGSVVEFNEDDERVILNLTNADKQLYDERFSGGSVIRFNELKQRHHMYFTGDRAIVYSYKGENHGIASISIDAGGARSKYDQVDDSQVYILDGDIDGTYAVDLDVAAKGSELPQAIIFDSNDPSHTYRIGPTGPTMTTLPWRGYRIMISSGKYYSTYLINPTAEDSEDKPKRCVNCGGTTTGTVRVGKPLYLDGFTLHESIGVSLSMATSTNLDVIKAVAEALELEWDVGEQGLTTSPKLGKHTNIILKENINTVIDTSLIQDSSAVASMLYSQGSDIDGLPLTSIIEDRKNRRTLGRTIQRVKDFRSIADYTTLIGVSREDLRKRIIPEERITVSHVGYGYDLEAGDTFIVKKNTFGPRRVRINHLEIAQSKASGIVYTLECIKWEDTIYQRRTLVESTELQFPGNQEASPFSMNRLGTFTITEESAITVRLDQDLSIAGSSFGVYNLTTTDNYTLSAPVYAGTYRWIISPGSYRIYAASYNGSLHSTGRFNVVR